MKTFIVAAAVLLGAFSMTSCKKDYTCTCTYVTGSTSISKSYDLNNQTVRDADDACERYEDDANVVPGATITCAL